MSVAAFSHADDFREMFSVLSLPPPCHAQPVQPRLYYAATAPDAAPLVYGYDELTGY